MTVIIRVDFHLTYRKYFFSANHATSTSSNQNIVFIFLFSIKCNLKIITIENQICLIALDFINIESNLIEFGYYNTIRTFVCNRPVSDIVNLSLASLFVIMYSTKPGSSCCCFLRMVRFATKAPAMTKWNFQSLILWNKS